MNLKNQRFIEIPENKSFSKHVNEILFVDKSTSRHNFCVARLYNMQNDDVAKKKFLSLLVNEYENVAKLVILSFCLDRETNPRNCKT